MMELITTVVVASLGSGGVVALIQAILQRKWSKQDKESETILNMRVALKIIIQCEVKKAAERLVGQQYITLDEKDSLFEMYHCYKSLGGNGRLDTEMAEIGKLEVRIKQ